MNWKTISMAMTKNNNPKSENSGCHSWFCDCCYAKSCQPPKWKEELQAISDTWGNHAQALFAVHSEVEFLEHSTEFPKNLNIQTSITTVVDGVHTHTKYRIT